MDKAGINVNCFKPHSTRAAAPSYAEAKDAHLSSVMKSAGWTQKKTLLGSFMTSQYRESPVFKLQFWVIDCERYI